MLILLVFKMKKVATMFIPVFIRILYNFPQVTIFSATIRPVAWEEPGEESRKIFG